MWEIGFEEDGEKRDFVSIEKGCNSLMHFFVLALCRRN